MSGARSRLHRTAWTGARPRGWSALLAGAFAATLGILASIAHAHAIVVAARPAMGSTVPQGELQISLDFNSRIDQQRSSLRRGQPDGLEAAVSVALNSASSSLAGSTKTTMGGQWRLVWQVLSVDGHITRGEVAFTVRDQASSP